MTDELINYKVSEDTDYAGNVGALRQIIVNIASRVTYRITTTKLA